MLRLVSASCSERGGRTCQPRALCVRAEGTNSHPPHIGDPMDLRTLNISRGAIGLAVAVGLVALLPATGRRRRRSTASCATRTLLSLRAGRTVTGIVVTREALDESIHGRLGCVDCHEGLTFPHPDDRAARELRPGVTARRGRQHASRCTARQPRGAIRWPPRARRATARTMFAPPGTRLRPRP